jgi:signal transduction histidine kinase
MNELQQFNKYKKMIFRYLFNLFDACFFSFSSSYVLCMHFVSFHSSNFINWALIRFFSSFFFFCNFAMMTCFAFSLMSLKLSISNRKRLRKNFFLFNFFCLVVCHICSFVFLKSELTIIYLMLLIKIRNSFSRTESFHCMLFAILRSQ